MEQYSYPYKRQYKERQDAYVADNQVDESEQEQVDSGICQRKREDFSSAGRGKQGVDMDEQCRRYRDKKHDGESVGEAHVFSSWFVLSGGVLAVF